LPSAGSRPLGERDILAFRMIGDVQLSPDGRSVAFVLVEQDAKANRPATSVWAVATEGAAEPRRLTAGPRDSRPRWSPDGSRLAFLGAREREWARDLFVLDMAGGEPRRVAALPRGIAEYGWSPDGECFALVGGPAFPADADREPPATPEEAHQRYVERVRHVDRFHYRLDGQGVLDDEARQLWLAPAGGDPEPRPLTDVGTDVAQPRWAPDGRIAFLSNLEPDHDRTEVREVYAVPVTGGAVERLTHLECVISTFSFGPDGTLATLRTDDAEPVGRHARVWLGDQCVTRELDRTSGPAVLADTSPAREPQEPLWACGRCYFPVADRGTVHVYRVAPGGPPERVVAGERVVVGLSAGGDRLAFVSTGPDDPLSLRVAGLDGAGERALFDPNPWVRERELGRLRRFDMRHGGWDIDGWALLPPGWSEPNSAERAHASPRDASSRWNSAEGDRVPTLLYVHGGPHAAYGWSFPFVFHVLAGAGYAVVYCNPPGSQTYSEAFSTRLKGAWGELDFPCFMAFVDQALEAGFADPGRLGVAGASYGGYSVLWAITHTDRFRAAVAMRPVAALEGFYGSSDVGWSFGASSMGAEPWEDADRYRRLSPLTYLDRLTTPLRLIAGTGDLRTPSEQAENVFVRLRKLRREVDMVVFHGESHGVAGQGRPWNRVRHLAAVREWFDRHLRSAG
jgi:dipeptidyl aminopeptidase/acylaminoacyl peptidase